MPRFLQSLRSWWTTYAERKDNEDDFIADTLLYDKTHLPRCAAVLGAAGAAADGRRTYG